MLTHGFVLDEKGQKMSKSLGNVMAPQDVMKSSGADILRLWVAASDYSDDLRIGPGDPEDVRRDLPQAAEHDPLDAGSAGALRRRSRIRSTSRDMPELERLMLHRLAELDGEIRTAYADYDYRKVVAVLAQFLNTDLSAFYFDIRKDTLYCEAPSSVPRKAALTVIDRAVPCDLPVVGADHVVHGGGSVAGPAWRGECPG